MSRASIPPMTNDNSSPYLNLRVDALLSKLYSMSFLQSPRFQMYLIDRLISKWFPNSPRELFEIMMKAEYKWRLALNAPYDVENDRMSSSVVGYSEQHDDPPKGVPTYEQGYNDGWRALQEKSLGDDAKKAIQDILITHRLKKSASGRMVCACNRGSDDVADWSVHVRIRILNYLKNEFVSLSSESGGGHGIAADALHVDR